MSSDQPYTPDEHDVRNVYVDYYMQHTGKLHSEADAEFQRFIAQVKLDAAEAERDRWREMWRQRGIKQREAETRADTQKAAHADQLKYWQGETRIAQAQIKAVEAVCDLWELAPDAHRPFRVTARSIRRALDA